MPAANRSTAIAKPAIFVGSSSEGLGYARAIQYELRDVGGVTLWNQGQTVFPLGKGYLEALMDQLDSFDYAILVLTPDDVVETRKKSVRIPRDNVMLELGLFMGHLGRERTFIVVDDNAHLASDLHGVTVAGYEDNADDRFNAVSPACTLIRERVTRLGFRDDEKNRSLTDVRVAIIGSTTDEIKASAQLTDALRAFYRELLSGFERLSYCLTTCGPEPLRSVIFSYYCEKLPRTSRNDMAKFERLIRWYWRSGAPDNLSFEPAIGTSIEGKTAQDRRLKEVADADIILAVAGRTGSRSYLQEIWEYHLTNTSGIDLARTPLILLSWFGGAAKDFLDERLVELPFLLDRYNELNPTEALDDWHLPGKPEELARRVVRVVQKLEPKGSAAGRARSA